MAWVAEENFDSYTSGDDLSTLNGGSGWSAGWAQIANNILVSNVESVDGANSANTADAGGGVYYQRLLTSTFTTGNLFIAAYMSTGSTELVFSLRTSTLATMGMTLTGGNIRLLARTPSVAWYTVGTYSVDTWYVFELDIDTTSDQYRLRWKTVGGSFGSWSSYYTPRTTDAINRISLGTATTANAMYVDSISATDPDSGTPPASFITRIMMS